MSKIRLKYESPWTTQSYLGKVCDEKAQKRCKYLCGAPKMPDLFFFGLFVSEDLDKLFISPLMDAVF